VIERKKHTPFKSTVVRRDRKGTWWFMNRPETGWASYGFPYASLEDVLAGWNVRLSDMKRDRFGDYVEAHPA
jgi:hypothetical protein